LKELEGTKKRRKGRRHQALSPSKNIISGAVSSTESRHSSSVHPHVWFLNHFEGPVSCPFMPRKVKTCAIPILQYWSSMHCMQCLLHFDNIMLTLCLHCDYLGMMVPRCCLSSERSRCIDCMSLSTCPSMCPHWEDSCSSAAVHRFDQATESSESTVISASAKIDLFLKCDWLMVQCCSSLFLFEFALCEFSMRWWSFEITCPTSYFQTSLDPSLACGQSVRPPSPIDPWTEPLQKLSQAKCGSVSTISRKVPTDSLLCWRSFSSCVSRSSQDTAVPFSCWTKSSALSAASKKNQEQYNYK
jgi:hypothetical protein